MQCNKPPKGAVASNQPADHSQPHYPAGLANPCCNAWQEAGHTLAYIDAHDRHGLDRRLDDGQFHAGQSKPFAPI